MKLRIFLATLVAFTTCQIVYDLNVVPKHKDQMNFLSYTARYAKSYKNTTEFNIRLRYWMAVDTFIDTYDEMGMTLGHNKFSDWSAQEKSKLLGARILETTDQKSRSLAELNEQDILTDSDLTSTEQTNQSKGEAKGKGQSSCGYGCKVCVSPTKCTQCQSKNFILRNGACSCPTKQVNANVTECYTCQSGTYWNTTILSCEKCSSSCATCTNSTSCTTCKPNYVKNSSNVCSCPINNLNSIGDCFVCASNQFFNGTGCQSCSSYCASCTRLSGNCTACIAPFSVQINGLCACNNGYFYNSTSKTCAVEAVCSPGKYLNSTINTCLSCGDNCANCTTKTGVCTNCVPNSIVKDPMNCIACKPNYVSNNQINCTCPNDNLNQKLDCFSCNATQFFNGTGCQNCNTNCTTCTRLTGHCSQCIGNLEIQTDGSCGCNTGYFYNSTSKTCILEAVCSTGQYLNYTSNTCLSCGINCTSCTKVTGACTSCVANSIFNSSDPSNCASCKPNYISNNSKTCQCPNDYKNSQGDCFACASAQFFNGSACQNCANNCSTCTGLNGNCLTCFDPLQVQSTGLCECNNSYFYNTTDNTCILEAECPTGQYLNRTNNTCLSCGINCANCKQYTGECITCMPNSNLSDAINCSPCKPNFVSQISNTCTCLEDNLNQQGECFACSSEQFFNGTDCQSCTTNCTSCTRLTGNCTKCIEPFSVQNSGLCECNPQYNYISSNNTCMQESVCDPRQYQTGVENNCLSCGINCATCANYTGNCTRCFDNNTISSTNPQNCVTCPPNYVSNNSNNCTCPNNNTNQNGDCFSCLSNEFFNSTGCQICPVNCTSCNRLTGECNNCMNSFSLQSNRSCSCENGQFYDRLKQSCVQETNCSIGYYLNGNDNTCIECGLNCTNCKKYTGVCTSCVDNNTLITSDTQNCIACQPNYVSNNSKNCSCPNNNTNSNRDCFACTASQFFNGTGCQNCNINCTTCTRLTSKCTFCAATFLLQTNGSCTCNQGFFYNITDNICIPEANCSKGEYLNSTNNTCLSCGLNCATCTKYTGNCTSCLNNNTLTTPNAFNCTACKPNYFSNDSKTCKCLSDLNSKGDCFACNATQFFNDSGCFDCSSNCTNTKCTKLTGKCVGCIPTLIFKSDGSCGCKTGYYFNSESKTCILEAVCSTGKYLNYTSNTCLSCGVNCTSCQKVTGVCTNCVTNNIKNQINPSNCVSCKPNQVSTNSINCTCPSNNVNSNNDCFSCASNQFFNGINCQDCGFQCVSCSNQSQGNCTSCLGNSTLDPTDPKKCTGCPFKVGPVADQKVCFNTSYSSTRIVPPFDANSTSFDWRNLTVVNPLQDQGQCGSCYSFAAIGGIESAYAIKTGKLYKLSEQHVISCDTKQLGCNGGWQLYALQYLGTNGTILSADYPYDSSQGVATNCKTNLKATQRVFYGASPAVKQVASNYSSFKAALFSQPVIITFAVGDDFMYYKGGIYLGQKCATSLNHAMLAVGFGVENGTEYATLKNSMGTSWGEQGYLKVALTQDSVGICQLYKQNYIALV